MAQCKECGKSVSFFNSVGDLCAECHFNQLRALQGSPEPPPPEADNPDHEEPDLSGILLTTETASDLKVAERLGIVTAEVAVGMNLLVDLLAGFRDVFGGRSKSYQTALKNAREAVLQDLRQEAHLLGANAVIAVRLDYSEISGGAKSMLFLVASGTAVQLAKP
jgi:uncharacterized protein YbjQ (UPF0145 family)